jgi:adenine deaminase
MNVASRRALIAVARGQAPADLYLRGATLLNVYTGELYPANVAIRFVDHLIRVPRTSAAMTRLAESPPAATPTCASSAT